MDTPLPQAIALKNAGFTWKPAVHDFFMIPDVGLDHRIFVLTDMMAQNEVLQGTNAITFNGAVEWALDFVLVTEAVWVPTEAQLRERLQTLVQRFELSLTSKTADLAVFTSEEPRVFQAETPPEAYAKALLALLGS